MDPFEEFEFKPLTDGLGFHKKKTPGAKRTQEQEDFEAQGFIKDQGLSLLDEPTGNPFSSPLPRKSSEVSRDPLNEILNTLQKDRSINFEEDLEQTKIPSSLQGSLQSPLQSSIQSSIQSSVQTPLSVPVKKAAPPASVFKSPFSAPVKAIPQGTVESARSSTQTTKSTILPAVKNEYRETNLNFSFEASL